MGWLYTHKDKRTSVAEFFKDRWNTDNETDKCEVIDCAVVKFKTAYMAIRHTRKATGQTVVYAVVALLGYDSKSSWNNFGYKDIGETSGPCEAQCPERILNLLSPVPVIEEFFGRKEPSYAQDWRDECLKNIEASRSARNFFTVGCVYEAEKPIRMSNATEVSKLEVIQSKPLRFKSLEHGYRFKLSRDLVKNMISAGTLKKVV